MSVIVIVIVIVRIFIMKEIITSGGAAVDVVGVRVPVSVGKNIFIGENHSVIGSIIVSTPVLLGGVSKLRIVDVVLSTHAGGTC
jgi:hypothetical protein